METKVSPGGGILLANTQPCSLFVVFPTSRKQAECKQKLGAGFHLLFPAPVENVQISLDL